LDSKVRGFGFRWIRGIGAFILQFRQERLTRRSTIGTCRDPWFADAAEAAA
jgi:hypothetical protein